MSDPRLVYPLDHPHEVSREDQLELLGGKAANLGVMARELGLPVPPGIVVTTAACRAYLAAGWPADLDEQLRAGMARIEAQIGRRFGDPADPLLVSVRSGAAASMPGMMDTILDLGINDATAAGLAQVTGDEAFAADCLRRFRAMFRDIVGEEAPDDPWAQLRLAVEAVFRSWNGDRARTYRAREGIADDLGTGVTVQAMVFGNRGPDSATGVVFTRNPATGESGLYGDVLFDAQGEDVVAGTHATEPIGKLDARLPEAAHDLRSAADRLEHHYRDLCDIEFTIEQGRLWLLQVRVGKRSPRAALRIALEMAQQDGFPLTRDEAIGRVAALLADPPRVASAPAHDVTPLITGLGASPGIATGEIAVTPDDAVRAADDGRAVILVRAETSPDDVHGMSRAAGILTATGGLASHAAVVARGWGIPAVVDARGLEVRPDAIALDGRVLPAGSVISIDGDTGRVYAGAIGGTSEICPEATTLLEWARELGISTSKAGDQPGPQAPDAAEAGTRGSIDQDALLAAIAVKGMATADGLASALGVAVADITTAVEPLVSAGDLTTTAGAWRLTDSGRTRRAAQLIAEQSALGADRASAALDDFVELDGQVKETVTAWQLRTVETEQVPNDHADAAYDAKVLERLASLHAGADAFLAGLAPGWPRAARYADRLALAIELAQAGDGRYVASPRVDSYHGTWFELHEELIALAGRSRADEVAAGRA